MIPFAGLLRVFAKGNAMRKTAWVAGLLLLAAGSLAAAPCSTSPTTLCLNASRFKVEVAWRDSRGRTGVGQAVPITADTGYFWFFSEANIELVIKVLDARSINQKYWVFFGALSSVEFDLTVTDTVTGASKTYHNPLGQFASVGDTGAFDPGPALVARRETVETAGSFAPPESMASIQEFIDASSSEAAAAFTPCLGPSPILGLSDCRFTLRVAWRDARGRTGQGNAVQLTNDTGYFWFFSPFNVELVVKVLDARAINETFWVFYGALSNVEYELAVTDLLTGVVKLYRNPGGTLASVGDTGAFPTGPSVTAVPDDARAVSADIDEQGGTISATAADGSSFRLEIPPDALVFPKRITMTPLVRVDGFPFTGGAKAGVQLEPEGLFLWEPATLTIQSAVQPPHPAARVTFAYRGTGDDFIEFPGVTEGGQVVLRLSHFSGYGDGVALTQEELKGLTYCQAIRLILDARVRQTSSRRFDGYIRRMVPLIIAQACGEITYPELAAQSTSIWEGAWNDVVYPELERLKEDCEPAVFQPVIELGLEYFHVVDTWITDPAFSQLKREIFYDTIKAILLKCIDDAYQHCKNDHDISRAWAIIEIGRFLQKAHLLDDNEWAAIFDKVEKCLRFEVSFDTQISVTAEAGRAGIQGQLGLHAVIPVRLESAGHMILSGEAPVNFNSSQLSYTGLPSNCRLATAPSSGSFRIDRMSVDGISASFDALFRNLLFAADMTYRPGNPTFDITIHCPNHPPQSGYPPFTTFRDAYRALHRSEFLGDGDDPNYLLLRWEPILNGALLAKREYLQSVTATGFIGTEQTTFTLNHTPE